MPEFVSFLPHINASLNTVATVLLFASFAAIKGQKITLHRNLMFAAFGVSAVFLACYLTYHYYVGSRLFPKEDYWMGFAYFYWAILASHIVLAMTVPVLVIWAMVLGLKDLRERHRRLVRWAFPIWAYVSVTGVMVYLMLYWIFVPKAS